MQFCRNFQLTSEDSQGCFLFNRHQPLNQKFSNRNQMPTSKQKKLSIKNITNKHQRTLTDTINRKYFTYHQKQTDKNLQEKDILNQLSLDYSQGEESLQKKIKYLTRNQQITNLKYIKVPSKGIGTKRSNNQYPHQIKNSKYFNPYKNSKEGQMTSKYQQKQNLNNESMINISKCQTKQALEYQFIKKPTLKKIQEISESSIKASLASFYKDYPNNQSKISYIKNKPSVNKSEHFQIDYNTLLPVTLKHSQVRQTHKKQSLHNRAMTVESHFYDSQCAGKRFSYQSKDSTLNQRTKKGIICESLNVLEIV